MRERTPEKENIQERAPNIQQVFSQISTGTRKGYKFSKLLSGCCKLKNCCWRFQFESELIRVEIPCGCLEESGLTRKGATWGAGLSQLKVKLKTSLKMTELMCSWIDVVRAQSSILIKENQYNSDTLQSEIQNVHQESKFTLKENKPHYQVGGH